MSVPPPAGFGGYPPHPAYGPAAGLRFSTILGDGVALLRRGFGPMALLGLGVGVVNAGITIGLYAAFATPFGYQTNVLVYQMGRYSYLDFMRVGVPLNLLTWAVGSAAIPFFFPF